MLWHQSLKLKTNRTKGLDLKLGRTISKSSFSMWKNFHCWPSIQRSALNSHVPMWRQPRHKRTSEKMVKEKTNSFEHKLVSTKCNLARIQQAIWSGRSVWSVLLNSSFRGNTDRKETEEIHWNPLQQLKSILPQWRRSWFGTRQGLVGICHKWLWRQRKRTKHVH